MNSSLSKKLEPSLSLQDLVKCSSKEQPKSEGNKLHHYDEAKYEEPKCTDIDLRSSININIVEEIICKRDQIQSSNQFDAFQAEN